MPPTNNIISTGEPLISCKEPCLFSLNMEPKEIFFSRDDDDLLLVSMCGDISLVQNFFNNGHQCDPISFVLPEGEVVACDKFLNI